MSDNYTYPVVFDYSEEGYIHISIPAFEGALSCVEVQEDPVKAAQEVLAMYIQDYEQTDRPFPDAQDIPELAEDERLVYVNVWMPYYRSRIKETFVKKTLTIPSWLDILAKNNNINFSALLVKALKEELHIK